LLSAHKPVTSGNQVSGTDHHHDYAHFSSRRCESATRYPIHDEQELVGQSMPKATKKLQIE
jgi:hypothetical protein